MSQSEDKPKLIIDEDWKTQVEREKAQLRDHSEPTAASEPTTPAATEAEEEDDLPPPPPAAFPYLVSMLGTQALAAMGQLHDGPEAPAVRLDYAKHYIDLLGLLEEKTKGNLSTQEYDLLADWLHQLRMAYVNMAKK